MLNQSVRSLSPQPRGDQVEFRRLQNISGASQRNSDVAFGESTEADGDLFYNTKKKQKNKKPWIIDIKITFCTILST